MDKNLTLKDRSEALGHLTAFLAKILDGGSMVKIVILAAAGNSPMDTELGMLTINTDELDMEFLTDWGKKELVRRLNAGQMLVPGQQEDGNVVNIFDGSPRK